MAKFGILSEYQEVSEKCQKRDNNAGDEYPMVRFVALVVKQAKRLLRNGPDLTVTSVEAFLMALTEL